MGIQEIIKYIRLLNNDNKKMKILRHTPKSKNTRIDQYG